MRLGVAGIANAYAEIAVLEDDWDGYGGHAPDIWATRRSGTFVDKYWSEELPHDIYPLPNSGIQIEYRDEGYVLELEFRAGYDSTFSYLYIVDDNKIREGFKEEHDLPYEQIDSVFRRYRDKEAL